MLIVIYCILFLNRGGLWKLQSRTKGINMVRDPDRSDLKQVDIEKILTKCSNKQYVFIKDKH